VVIVSYPSTYRYATTTGTNVTPIVSGGNITYIFTSSGSIIF
jgi:hypothetical protein